METTKASMFGQSNTIGSGSGSGIGAIANTSYMRPQLPQTELRVTIEKVANGYVLRLAEGYGELVNPGNTFIAADIKELGDLFISTVVNHQLDN